MIYWMRHTITELDPRSFPATTKVVKEEQVNLFTEAVPSGPKVERWDEYDLTVVRLFAPEPGDPGIEVRAYGQNYRVRTSTPRCDRCSRHLLYTCVLEIKERLIPALRDLCADPSYFDRTFVVCAPCVMLEQWEAECRKAYSEEGVCKSEVEQKLLTDLLSRKNRRKSLLRQWLEEDMAPPST